LLLTHATSAPDPDVDAAGRLSSRDKPDKADAFQQ